MRIRLRFWNDSMESTISALARQWVPKSHRHANSIWRVLEKDSPAG